MFAGYGKALVTAKTRARITNRVPTNTPWTKKGLPKVKAKADAKAKAKVKEKAKARERRVMEKPDHPKVRAKEKANAAEQMLRPNGPKSKVGQRLNGPPTLLQLPSLQTGRPQSKYFPQKKGNGVRNTPKVETAMAVT